MVETLLTQSSIKLFGRILTDIKFSPDNSMANLGGNNFMRSQMVALTAAPVAFNGAAAHGADGITQIASTAGIAPGMVVTGPAGVLAPDTYVQRVIDPTSLQLSAPATGPAPAGSAFAASNPPSFARIYAFSFEGAIYTMPRPMIFLVHGAGQAVDLSQGSGRTTVEQSGVIAREWEFASADGKDIRYWEYEKGDFSIRLEPESGPLEQILLQAAARAGADRSGAGLEIRSGAGVSGAGVSGAGVSGAGVSGAGVSGAGVSGAGLRR